MSPAESAIVLCAGRGKRLKPYTDTVPKPLLPVNGLPTLDYILSSLKLSGIKKVVLVTNYLAEQLEAYAYQQDYYSASSICCVRQSQLSGTADAATAALEAKPEWFESTFLLTASDYLVSPLFYSDLLNAFEQSGKHIAVSLKRIDESELASRSSIRFNDVGDVMEVIEKPAPGTAPSSLAANLIFVLPPDIVAGIAKVQASPRGEKEIQSAVNSYLNQHGPACGLEQETPKEWHPDMQQ